MKEFKILLILLLVPVFRVFSCGNEYEEDYIYTTADGKTVESVDYLQDYHFHHGFNTEQLTDRKLRLETSLKNKYDYKLQSDYALVLLKLGMKKQALDILEDLIRSYPNEYNINANLGTAYELNGDPKQALKYIRRAVAINPGSHKSSEWIHVRILEAKIQMDINPLYLKDISILDLDLDLDRLYSEKEMAGFRKVKEELIWQLNERIAFVAAPDPVVANLLADLGKLVAITEYIELAIPVYAISLEYQPLNFGEVLRWRDSLYEKIYWAKIRKYSINILIAVSVCFLSAFLFFKWRKRRRSGKQHTDKTLDKPSEGEPAFL